MPKAAPRGSTDTRGAEQDASRANHVLAPLLRALGLPLPRIGEERRQAVEEARLDGRVPLVAVEPDAAAGRAAVEPEAALGVDAVAAHDPLVLRAQLRPLHVADLVGGGDRLGRLVGGLVALAPREVEVGREERAVAARAAEAAETWDVVRGLEKGGAFELGVAEGAGHGRRVSEADKLPAWTSAIS